MWKTLGFVSLQERTAWQRGGQCEEGVGQREGRQGVCKEGRAGSQQSGPLLPSAPEGKSGLERRPIPCLIPLGQTCSLFIPVQRAGKTYFPPKSLFMLLSHFPVQ